MTINDCVYCKDGRKPIDVHDLLYAYKAQAVPVDHALLHLMELMAKEENDQG